MVGELEEGYEERREKQDHHLGENEEGDAEEVPPPTLPSGHLPETSPPTTEGSHSGRSS